MPTLAALDRYNRTQESRREAEAMRLRAWSREQAAAEREALRLSVQLQYQAIELPLLDAANSLGAALETLTGCKGAFVVPEQMKALRSLDAIALAGLWQALVEQVFEPERGAA